MKESVAIAKDAAAKKESSPTKSIDNSIHRVRNEPERKLGSLRGVIDNIRHDGGTPSVDSIATELSGMHTAQRAPALLALQQTHGNRYVQRVVTGIQAKLKVGQLGDIYEQEADRVAEEVIGMPEPQVQRQAEEEEKTLRAKGTSGHISEVNSDLESRIQSLQGGGQPLPESARIFFEPRFGHDFSSVRIHNDASAAETAQSLNAEAFTIEGDVYLGAGKYSPETSLGKRLLAHELTHVIQQTIGISPAMPENRTLWQNEFGAQVRPGYRNIKPLGTKMIQALRPGEIWVDRVTFVPAELKPYQADIEAVQDYDRARLAVYRDYLADPTSHPTITDATSLESWVDAELFARRGMRSADAAGASPGTGITVVHAPTNHYERFDDQLSRRVHERTHLLDFQRMAREIGVPYWMVVRDEQLSNAVDEAEDAYNDAVASGAPTSEQDRLRREFERRRDEYNHWRTRTLAPGWIPRLERYWDRYNSAIQCARDEIHAYGETIRVRERVLRRLRALP